MSFQSWLSGFQGPQVQAGPTGGQAGTGPLWDAANNAKTWVDEMMSKGPDGTFDWGQNLAQAQQMYKILSEKAAGAAGPGINPDYYGDLTQNFDAAKGFLMDQAGPGGMLAPSSMNPYTRQLAEGSALAERERVTDQGFGLASAGVNPLMAQGVMRESSYGAQESLGQQFAGFEQNLQGAQYGAGQDLVNLSTGITNEMTGRKEDQWRWLQEWLLSDKNNTAMIKAGNSAANKELLGSVFGLAGSYFGSKG